MTSIHDRFDEVVSLAKTYAEDGAFRTAAARLRELADTLDAHAAAVLDDMTEKAWPRNRKRAIVKEMAKPGSNPDKIGVDHLGPHTAGGTMPIIEHDEFADLKRLDSAFKDMPSKRKR